MTYGKRLSFGHLRTFRCRAHVLTPAPLQRKPQPQSIRKTFTGYEAGSTTYRFLIDGNVIVRRDAVFEEDDRTNDGDASSDEDEDGSSDEYDDFDGSNPRPSDEAGADGADDDDANNVTEDTTGDGMKPPLTAGGLGKTPLPTADAGGSQEKVAATGARADGARVVRLANPPTAAPGGSHIEEGGDITDAIAAAKLLVTGSKGESDDEEAPRAAGPSGGHRRSGRHRAEPERFGQGGEAMAVRGVTNPDKMTLSQARKEADWPSFDAAVRAEVDSLWGNGTWVLADLPPGAKLLPAQMLCERKRGADGEVARHKGRFVACGNHQVAGRDYADVWAPVARHATLRAVLSTAAASGMVLYQLDVETAFLNGTVDEELYLQQPRGYERGGAGKVCRLVKAIYGLKQAARAWYLKLVELMEQMGMTQCTSDPCLFTRRGADGNAEYLLVYVDDILLMGRTKAAIESMKQTVTAAFSSRDIGPPTYFLGLHIGRDEAAGTLKVSQHQYILSLVECHGL